MKNKLPKRFKERWIKALLSGKFEQGRSNLKAFNQETHKTKYCCLGVAGEVCGVPDMNDWGFFEGQLAERAVKKGLPKLLIEDTTNPIVKKLVYYNDNGKSFKWIATYIKRYL